MTTDIVGRRRPRGRYPKTREGATPKRIRKLPEYLEVEEVNAIIRLAPNPKAKLLMLEQWRAGLRVSEALDLEVRDLSLDSAYPTLRVRCGRGGKSRLVPVHPELHSALTSALSYGNVRQWCIVVGKQLVYTSAEKSEVNEADLGDITSVSDNESCKNLGNKFQ